MIEELISRYQRRLSHNDFPPNPYYHSAWEERKEIIEKIKELKQKKV